jgi:hypothetical protein
MVGSEDLRQRCRCCRDPLTSPVSPQADRRPALPWPRYCGSWTPLADLQRPLHLHHSLAAKPHAPCPCTAILLPSLRPPCPQNATATLCRHFPPALTVAEAIKHCIGDALFKGNCAQCHGIVDVVVGPTCLARCETVGKVKPCLGENSSRLIAATKRSLEDLRTGTRSSRCQASSFPTKSVRFWITCNRKNGNTWFQQFTKPRCTATCCEPLHDLLLLPLPPPECLPAVGQAPDLMFSTDCASSRLSPSC